MEYVPPVGEASMLTQSEWHGGRVAGRGGEPARERYGLGNGLRRAIAGPDQDARSPGGEGVKAPVLAQEGVPSPGAEFARNLQVNLAFSITYLNDRASVRFLLGDGIGRGLRTTCGFFSAGYAQRL